MSFFVCKVILIERDPDSWLKSYQHLIKPPSYWDTFCLLPLPGYLSFRMFLKSRHKWWQDEYNYSDAAEQVMHFYINKIKSNIPSERILLFKLEDGWEPLCKFLNKDIPEEDFPHMNDHVSRNQQFLIRKQKGLAIWMTWMKQIATIATVLSAVVWVYKHHKLFFKV